MDPQYNNGDYEAGNGPREGMAVARKIGTICYRSRDEFDSRFEWAADDTHEFDVERYKRGKSFGLELWVSFLWSCFRRLLVLL